jgi:hypothetical protein
VQESFCFQRVQAEPMLDAVGQVVGAVDALAFHDVGHVMRQIVINLLEG